MTELTLARISLSDLFLQTAELIAQRATCPRASVGCVIVQDDHIVSCGYNGSPPKQPHCIDVGCILENNHCVRAVHAEANAIAYAARKGIGLEGATLYCTHSPCPNCKKWMETAGIVDNHYLTEYNA